MYCKTGAKSQAHLLIRRSSQYRYFHETDTLSVNFLKAEPGLIDNTEDAVPGLLVDYTQEQNYSPEANTLTISFVDSPQHCSPICTDDDRISIWVDHVGNWESVVIAHAIESVAS